ncbi:PREDICTED: MAP7 domain-containing protein 1-like [Tarenaya hassleriana]|uniref:MAP7 domain-containing protein 1-like n=1 Tax=Tarenaya hassleriana TaxID=28532 RepID=UPI00053C69C7|nr:PREDICTED: MAP7 domain-containing protein 1-like [Tarenaya hassleriana]
MRSGSEDKGICYGLGPAAPAISNGSGGAISFEFHKTGSNRTPNHHRSAMGKPTPSKWDDAQKWLSGVGLTHKSHYSKSGTKPRNSNADDRRLIASASQREREAAAEEEEEDEDGDCGPSGPPEVQTKKVDSEETGPIWRISKKPPENIPATEIRSVCVRDMGTEMTPIGSQEPSRTTTPVRNTTPVARSPVSSPARVIEPAPAAETKRQVASNVSDGRVGKSMNDLEARAMAWDEAERAKFMARYKREEVKIQAWENHQKRKAEMEMKKMEVKAERMKARAEEKLANKMAATRRIAEERRANAEAKLNEKAVRTSERADYIRRTGHLPCSLSFKLPSLCW